MTDITITARRRGLGEAASDWIGRTQAQLSDHVHASGDELARVTRLGDHPRNRPVRLRRPHLPRPPADRPGVCAWSARASPGRWCATRLPSCAIPSSQAAAGRRAPPVSTTSERVEAGMASLTVAAMGAITDLSDLQVRGYLKEHPAHVLHRLDLLADMIARVRAPGAGGGGLLAPRGGRQRLGSAGPGGRARADGRRVPRSRGLLSLVPDLPRARRR